MLEERKVPKGYKMTEVGVIPEDWECKKLGDLGECIIGLTYKPENIKEDGLLVLRSSNIGENRLKFNDNLYVNVDVNERLIVKKDDLLICVRNGSRNLIGKCALIDEKTAGSTFGAFMSVYRSPYSKYVYNYFQTDYIKRQINENMGATINQITNKNLNSFVIAIPNDDSEQQAIAEALSDVDSLIASLEKLIDKKKKVKQGAMQELLTAKRRLPGYSGEWEVKKLGEIADIRTGKKNNQDKVSDGLYPFYVRSQDVERINTYSYDGEAVLVPGEGGIGDIFHYINGKFEVHQRVYKISDFSGVSGKYVYYYMKQSFGIHAMKNTVKATVDSLRLPTFQEFELYIPTILEEQQAISQILSEMDSEIETLEQKLNKYKTIKQGMMQELLTGRIRLV